MLKNKTLMITGGSRGIGLAIALRFATAGYQIVVLTKDSSENIGKLKSQIGKLLLFEVDVTQQDQIKEAVDDAVKQFGWIDLLVNNTSAICLNDTLHTSAEQFDLMISTSVRATFLLSQACFPYLKKAQNPHIINISPPLNIDVQWFKDNLAFSICKYAMSLCTLGMSAEFLPAGIAVNSLWPQTTIATQTIKDHFVPKVYEGSRWPSIMADAAYELASRTSCEWTGRFFTDESLLRKTGVVDFSHYAVDPKASLMQPFFIPLEAGMVPISREYFLNSP